MAYCFQLCSNANAYLILWEAGSVAFPLPPELLWCKKLSLCLFHTLSTAVLPLTIPVEFQSLCFLGLPCSYHCKYNVYFDNQNRKATVARTLCGFRRHCHSGMWEVNWTKPTKTNFLVAQEIQSQGTLCKHIFWTAFDSQNTYNPDFHTIQVFVSTL